MFRNVLKKVGMAMVALGASAPAPRFANPSSPVEREKRTHQLRRESPDGRQVLLAGTVKMLGMNTIKEDLGASWPVVSGKAHGVAEAVIRRHLSDQDVYERHDEESYVLCFAALEKSEANRKTEQIVNEIKTALLREVPEAASVRVGHFVAEVDYDQVSQSDGSILGSLLSSLDTMKAEAEASFQERRQTLLRETQLAYSPVLDVKAHLAFMNRCLLADTAGKIALEQLQIVSSAEELMTVVADLDFMILQRAVRALHGLVQSNEKSIFLVPVHFPTLNEKSFRDGYYQLCSAIPKSYRKLLAIELRSMPASVPMGRILEILPQLRQFSRSVILNVNPNESRLGELMGGGVFGVSLELPELGDNPGVISQKLTRLVASAKATNLHIIAHSADTLGHAKAAIAAGVDSLDGEAVAPKSMTPKGTHRLKAIAA